MREKDKKKVISDVVIFLLILWEQFTCSVESCKALIFWPLRLLVRHTGVMPGPVRPCAMKVGDACTGIFVVRGLGGTAAVTPLLWRYGCRRDRMTGVISSRDVVLVPLLTAHGHIHHVDGTNTVLGSPWLPVSPEGSTCPSNEAETHRGGRAPLMTPRGLGRGGETSPETPIVPEASP
jgi:hypothetical protein